MFYPENVERAARLQQLVDSMGNMQSDIKHYGEEIDKKNTAIRPLIDALLKDKNIDTIEDLIAKSLAKMSPDDRKQFESLIEAAKKSKAGFDWTYFAAGLLMLPEGAILTSQAIVAAGRFITRLSAIQGLVQVFRSAESGTAAAAEAAAQLEKAALAAEDATKDVSMIGEGGVEIQEASRFLRGIGTALKVLGAVGFVVTIIVGAIEIIQGAAQKEKLIEAIQKSQPARLCIAFYKREASNLIQQLELMVVYYESMTGPDKDEDVADRIGKKVVKNIKRDNSTIKLNELENELENQDKSAGNFYGKDDLGLDQVVAKAKDSK
ncbi:hypothetical protein C8Q75DRAFT_845686 [Abortiporus biennis]|nr:hypothetical protein C8Q75DRAFT_845686 [Abortiporus biennis]